MTLKTIPGIKTMYYVCIVRESNPGRPRGRRAFYHWTNDAHMGICEVLENLIDVT